jgi:hypothetical protein
MQLSAELFGELAVGERHGAVALIGMKKSRVAMIWAISLVI